MHKKRDNIYFNVDIAVDTQYTHMYLNGTQLTRRSSVASVTEPLRQSLYNFMSPAGIESGISRVQDKYSV